jgi:hypothetical protein
METTTTVETTAVETTTVSAARGWVDQTPGEQMFSLFVFGLSTAATVAFVYYLVTDPSRLNELWAWSRSLPLLVQGVLWLLFLPWMIALLIWSLPWAFAVRIVLVVAMLVFTQYLMFPFK